MLTNKKIFITGITRGIGHEIDIACRANHAETFGCARHPPAEDTVCGKFYKCDVSHEEDFKPIVNDFTKNNTRLDGLVLNAGIVRDRSFKKMTTEEWNDVINVNLNGSRNTINALYRFLNPNSSIIFVASVVGLRGAFGQTNYAASKAAIIGFAKSLAKETARENIRVNVIAPGYITTAMTENIPAEVKETIVKRIPLGRMGQPKEVADSALFLLSNMSSYVTGTILEVNGGIG